MSDTIPYGATKRQRRVLVITFGVLALFCLFMAAVMVQDFATNKDQGERMGDIFALCSALAAFLFTAVVGVWQMISLRRRLCKQGITS